MSVNVTEIVQSVTVEETTQNITIQLSGTQGPAGSTNHLMLTNIGTNTHAQIDTDLARLANTSGTNTGDQDLSGKENVGVAASLIAAHVALSDPHSQYLTEAEADLEYEAKNVNIQAHIIDTANPHATTKSQVGLSNADNTSDINKPVSTAQQTALDLKANLASPALTGNPTAPTQAPLDSSTKIATTAYVDFATPSVPDATTLVKGIVKLAGDLGGTALLPTVPALASKEPTITATTSADYYRGDKTFQALNKSAVGLSNVDNTSDANKPISTATQTALDGKVDKNAAITGATKTKISYDAKGLVTSGADADTSDINPSTDRNYVTDAELLELQNLDVNYVPYTGGSGDVDLAANRIIASEFKGNQIANSFGQVAFDLNNQTIYDGTFTACANYNTRILLQSNGSYPAVDWEGLGLYNIGLTNNGPLLEWSSTAGGVKIYSYYSGGYHNSGDFVGYQLNDPGGLALDWISHKLHSFNTVSVDWAGRQLYPVDQSFPSIDWGLRLLYSSAFGGVISMDYANHILNNAGGFLSINYTAHQLYSYSAGIQPSLDYDLRRALAIDGATILFDWSGASNEVAIGASGTPFKAILSATDTLDFPSTSTDSDLTMTVTGAEVGDTVMIGVPPACIFSHTVYFAWVSATDTVTIRFSVTGSGPHNPPSDTFRATVIKY